MSPHRLAAVGATAALGAGLAGCESTQSKSARLQRDAKGSQSTETGLKVTEGARGVKVRSTALLTDANGTALVVELRNTTPKALAAVPLAVDVMDAKGASVYRNDTAGLETALVSAALLPSRRTQVWVHDQVAPSGTPRSARARPGTGGRPLRGKPPRLVTAAPRLEEDPTSGLAGVGTVVNRSGVDQRDLVVNVVARRGSKIVAAGRAVVRRLKAGDRAHYQAFLIGDAQGARLEASAPPTTLR